MNDRDFKFINDFWKIIFFKLNILILIFTIYYSQIDNQSKRINQIIEIILRFHFIIISKNDWINILFYLQAESNNIK